MTYVPWTSTTLPTCLELVGLAEVREAFVEAHRDKLADAVLLRFDGVAISLHGVVVPA